MRYLGTPMAVKQQELALLDHVVGMEVGLHGLCGVAHVKANLALCAVHVRLRDDSAVELAVQLDCRLQSYSDT